MASKQQRKHVSVSEIQVGECTVPCTQSARNLGVVFDEALNMDLHVTAVCRSSYMFLRKINSIRKVLSRGNAETLVHAFVTSRLDNGNSMMYGITESSLCKLQRVQNAAARCVMMVRKYDHISPALAELHWLPIRQRIIFKILLLTWRALNNQAPDYLNELLEWYQPYRSLRSSSTSLLRVPRTNLRSYGDRAFSVVAPRLWNELPLAIRQSSSRNQTQNSHI